MLLALPFSLIFITFAYAVTALLIFITPFSPFAAFHDIFTPMPTLLIRAPLLFAAFACHAFVAAAAADDFHATLLTFAANSRRFIAAMPRQIADGHFSLAPPCFLSLFRHYFSSFFSFSLTLHSLFIILYGVSIRQLIRQLRHAIIFFFRCRCCQRCRRRRCCCYAQRFFMPLYCRYAAATLITPCCLLPYAAIAAAEAADVSDATAIRFHFHFFFFHASLL